jgi:DNA-binding beta-propeller fold protein YncE
VASIFLLAILWIPFRHWVGPAAAQERDGTSGRRPLVLDRTPVRSLEDPNPVFRAVAIDTEHAEVFFANDKESAGTSVLVYPTQFRPTDRILEPRRRIAGPKTDLGMVCGLALSPQHGELYTVSGETGTLNVFPLNANSNVGPQRRLQGVIPRASAGVFLDATNDELFITTQHVNRISVYPRTFREDEEPRRYIQGPRTGLADPHGIYVDGNTNEIFVTNHGHWRETQPGEGEVRGPDSLTRTSLGYNVPGRALALGPSTGKFLPSSVTVFSRTARGDVAPVRTIQGPRTLLNLPDGMYRDPVSGELVIANTGDDSVLFFDKDASGDAAPVRVLKGRATKLNGPVGVSIDASHNELWVASWDNHIAAVFPRTAQGNVAPLRVIRTAPESAPLASMGRIGAVAYDPKRKQILAPN